MFSNRTHWNLETNRLGVALETLRASGKPLLDLTISNPTECGFQYDEEAIRKALSLPAVLRYEPNPRGMPPARAAVAQYYAAQRIQVAMEDIFMTTSTSEAYSFAFRLLCDPGTEILVPTPSYPLFDFLADLHDVCLVRYPLVYEGGWRIDLPALQAAITERTRGIIVVHPNNPTGHYVKVAEREQLNQICAARNLALIADEVFLDFCLSEEKPPSFASNSLALTFTMSGLSKISGLPQMKAAWLVLGGPEKLKIQAAARLEVMADTYLSMSAPVQLGLPVLLGQRFAFQEQVIVRLRHNLTEMDRQLADRPCCSRLNVAGGWYAPLWIAGSADEEELTVQLLQEKGVYIHPGHFFGFSVPGHLVICLLARETDFAEGFRRLLDYLL